jgi:hypothetical protein
VHLIYDLVVYWYDIRRLDIGRLVLLEEEQVVANEEELLEDGLFPRVQGCLYGGRVGHVGKLKDLESCIEDEERTESRSLLLFEWQECQEKLITSLHSIGEETAATGPVTSKSAGQTIRFRRLDKQGSWGCQRPR